MQRWMYLVVASGLVASGCNPVESPAVDAAPAIDAEVPPDAMPVPDADIAPDRRTIVAVHRVLELQPTVGEIKADLVTTTSRLLVLATASAQRAATPGSMGVSILIDDKTYGACESTSNEVASSKALNRRVFLVEDVAPGAHVVSVLAQPGTTLTASDYVDVTVIELGPAARVSSIFQNKAGVDGGAALFSGDLEATGATGVLFLSGSGWSASGGLLGAQLLLDDVVTGQIHVATNDAFSHKAFVPSQLVLTPAAGTRRLALKPLPGVIMNQDDRVNALWLELGDDVVATQVLDRKAGPLPVVAPLTTHGGPVLFLSSGSAWRFADSTATGIGTQLSVGGAVVAHNRVATREAANHKTLLPTATLAEVPAGDAMVQIAVEGGTPTTSDGNDYFGVTALELSR